jgi:hypothetical protein
MLRELQIQDGLHNGHVHGEPIRTLPTLQPCRQVEGLARGWTVTNLLGDIRTSVEELVGLEEVLCGRIESAVVDDRVWGEVGESDLLSALAQRIQKQ